MHSCLNTWRRLKRCEFNLLVRSSIVSRWCGHCTCTLLFWGLRVLLSILCLSVLCFIGGLCCLVSRHNPPCSCCILFLIISDPYVARCAVVRGCSLFVFVFAICLFACDRSTSPPGGNQVDGLPPALGRFSSRGLFRREFLEICEFVWQTVIFLKVFGVKAFDWYNQIAKRICNEGAGLSQGPVP